MSEILNLQHIATKHALLNILKAKYDYDERVLVGDVIHALEDVKVESTVNPYGEAQLAALTAAVEAARVALQDLKEYYLENDLSYFRHNGQVEENPLFTGIQKALTALKQVKP